MVGAQEVDAGHVEADDLGGAHGGRALQRRDLYHRGAAAAVEVRTELAFAPLAFHRRHHAVADDQASDVGAACLFDELLGEDVGVEAAEGLDDRLGGLGGLGQDDPDPLGALDQLDDHRRAAADVDEVSGGLGVVGEGGDRQPDPLAGQELERAELVAGAADRHRLVDRVDAHHLELPHHGSAEERVAGPDPRDDRVEPGQLLVAEVDGGPVRGDVHVALEVVDHPDLVPAPLRGVHERHRRVEPAVERQDPDLHRRQSATDPLDAPAAQPDVCHR
jgi:hypothetical protein